MPGLCALCPSPSLYTCPRCSTRTCSLTCIKAHKSKTRCSGERDPTAFVKPRDIGQGVWADDYRWLEEGRRKVAKWGETLPRSVTADENGKQGRGRGGRAGPRGRQAHGKTDAVRAELRKRGCEVDFMAPGMGRRKLNQSSWNPKSQMLHLTVQLVAPLALTQSDQPHDEETKTISHPRVLFAAPDTNSLPNVTSLLPPNVRADDIIFALPFYSPSRPSSFLPPSKKVQYFFPPLNPTTSIADSLKRTAWIEFPIIHILPRRLWDERLRKGEIAVVSLLGPIIDVPGGGGGSRTRDSGWGAKRKASTIDSYVEPVQKKVKVVREVGLAAMAALGEYASSEDEDEGVEDGEVVEVVPR